MAKLIHVAAAAIFNPDGQLLLALRDKKQHQGGLWEFPGGKVEAGEDVRSALARELHEELGIDIDQQATRPLIQVPYHYPDKSVLLDVFRVEGFSGKAWGKEGQPLAWVGQDQLSDYAFPAANKPIVNALLLPETIAITPELAPQQYPEYIQQVLNKGAAAVMLRAKHLDLIQQQAIIQQLNQLWHDKWKGRWKDKWNDRCSGSQFPLIWNNSVEHANACRVAALHLSSSELRTLDCRTAFSGRWLGASCHSEEEIAMAVAKDLDYITLSPVQPTRSHPDAGSLGWERFRELVAECSVPVYALGGVSRADLKQVIACGGQGVAGIRGFA